MIITYEYLPYIDALVYIKYEAIVDKQMVDGNYREYVWGRWSTGNGTEGSNLTSGSLVVNRYYRILSSGGNFTIIGSSDNEVNTVFKALATTPIWNGASLVEIPTDFTWEEFRYELFGASNL